MHIYLYGPSGSGKSTIGKALAGQLGLPFIDLDERIELQAGQSIPIIFAREGEWGFRIRESAALAETAASPPVVISLGGGALLADENRHLAETSGQVLCLTASFEVLVERLAGTGSERPLLTGLETSDGFTSSSQGSHPSAGNLHGRLSALLASRADHYASFPLQLDTSRLTPRSAAWLAQVRLGRFHITGMGTGYDVRIQRGGLDRLEALLQDLKIAHGTLALVSDTTVAGLYADRAINSLQSRGASAALISIPVGEAYKTIRTVQDLWERFLEAGLERSSTVIALGGGVVGDLSGFAAAVFLRGITWVNLPTTLLAMIDASLGGKTGVDLPQGKNLVGAFHPPRLVLADPGLLHTLPEAELRSGLAEVVKHGLIGDAGLFDLCEMGYQAVLANLDEVVRRAIAVKVRIIQEDPYEHGRRAALNLGHTLGHALELVSDFRIRHGEAVAIGMVAAAYYAERSGLAENGLAARLREALTGLGLPVEIPAGLNRKGLLDAIGVDKKRKGGKVRLALPVQIGEVHTGIVLKDSADLLEGR